MSRYGGPLAEKTTNDGQGCSWLIGGAVVLALLISIGKCASKSEQAAPSSAATWSDEATPAPTPTPTPVLPLVGVSTRRASRDFQIAMAEPGGDKIYSENCFAALGAAFNWPKLDACGAFDQLVIRRINLTNFDGTSDVAYFDPETAAGRYLAAATSHGSTADEADERFAALQRLSANARVPALTPPVVEDITDDAEETGEVAPTPAPADDNVEDDAVAEG
jgi:hypothetical protein